MDRGNEAARSGGKDAELDFAARAGDALRIQNNRIAWPARWWPRQVSMRTPLRNLAVGAGAVWCILFVVVGLGFHLQMYGDGSMFSYAVAVEDAWAFHWHNIAGRLFVYLYAFLPSEAYVALFQDPRGGIFLYGLLFFSAPLLGLIATYAADRSQGRRIFAYACASTACLCPLVFGFPTEVWVSLALFWPALAICYYSRGGFGNAVLVFISLLALVLTHAGAVLFAIAILMILAMRGLRDPGFLRALGLFFLVMAVWSTIQLVFRPDSYYAPVLYRAALHVFDVEILTGDLVLLLAATFAVYGLSCVLLMRLNREKAHIYAASITAAMLAVYWIWFDQALHTENRYYLRTALLLGTPAFGLLAGIQLLLAEGRMALGVPHLPRLMAALSGDAATRFAAGAFAVMMLVHAVETAKFVSGWSDYTAAVRKLATGTASDPSLGDPRFVSSTRISDDLNRLSWFSTTQYLSVLVAPNFLPTRLVVDPDSNYFWLSCRVATENLMSQRAVPAESRRLVQVEACQHRGSR